MGSDCASYSPRDEVSRAMNLKLHANATTTPKTRAYVRQSSASNASLARELGIHPRTVARWKGRRGAACVQRGERTFYAPRQPHRQTSGPIAPRAKSACRAIAAGER